jgi:hypothetical protein
MSGTIEKAEPLDQAGERSRRIGQSALLPEEILADLAVDSISFAYFSPRKLLSKKSQET